MPQILQFSKYVMYNLEVIFAQIHLPLWQFYLPQATRQWDVVLRFGHQPFYHYISSPHFASDWDLQSSSFSFLPPVAKNLQTSPVISLAFDHIETHLVTSSHKGTLMTFLCQPPAIVGNSVLPGSRLQQVCRQ